MSNSSLRGSSLFYDRSINFHAVLGLWDPETFELLRRIFITGGLLPKNAVVADVGGNIGYYTLWFAQFAVEAGRVYAFEPNPEAFAMLRRYARSNNIRLTDVAQGTVDGTLEASVWTRVSRSSEL